MRSRCLNLRKVKRRPRKRRMFGKESVSEPQINANKRGLDLRLFAFICGSIIKQDLRARLPELLQPRIPRTKNLSRTLTTLHTLQRVRIREQTQVAINFPIGRI